MDVHLALNRLVLLPIDIILKVLSLLEDTDHIKEFFLYWPETRNLVKLHYYKELHCIVSPLGGQNHVCLNGNLSSRIFDLNYYGEIDDFFLLNADLMPEKMMFLTGNDFYSLVDLFRKYEKKIKAVPKLELLLGGSHWNYDLKDMEFILAFPNLYRLQLGRFNFVKAKKLLSRTLPKLENLKILQFLAHNVVNWSDYKWPPNLSSLDCSWNSQTNALTLDFNDNLQELYLNMSNIDSSNLLLLIERLPSHLKILMLTYNNIEIFYGDQLNDNVEKIDISFNKITHLIDPNVQITSSTKIFPSELRELNMSSNFINDSTLQFLQPSNWPPNLRILNLSGNRITDLYSIRIPDSVESLQLDANDLKFQIDPLNPQLIKPYKFPRNLKYLLFFNSMNLTKPLEDSETINKTSITNYIEFPSSLRHLSIIGCNLKSIHYFKFPTFINVITLNDNNLTDLQTYRFDWSKLFNLEKVEVDEHVDLTNWIKPPNLK